MIKKLHGPYRQKYTFKKERRSLKNISLSCLELGTSEPTVLSGPELLNVKTKIEKLSHDKKNCFKHACLGSKNLYIIQ